MLYDVLQVFDVCLYSEDEDKQDVTEEENKQEGTVTRQGYTYNFFEVPAVISFFPSRRIKIKTEKAIYAEKVGAESSGDLK